jgi:hypothetical protein
MFSQNTSMTLTGAGSNILAGVYIGPYYATINGQANVPIICDDFSDESYIGESWSATKTTVSSNAATMMSVKLGLNTSTQQTDYAEASFLAEQLLAGAVCPPGTTTCSTTSGDHAGDIQFALWQLFDSTGNPTPFSYLSGTDLTNAQAWLNYATTAGVAPAYTTDSNVAVYSPYPKGPPQEFLQVQMPEAQAPIYWAIDLAGLGALVFYARRRSQSATVKS